MRKNTLICDEKTCRRESENLTTCNEKYKRAGVDLLNLLHNPAYWDMLLVQ